jgi:hypothetical protein
MVRFSFKTRIKIINNIKIARLLIAILQIRKEIIKTSAGMPDKLPGN